ncbi:MAG TPA: hypothetical protein ENL46_07745, partial [Candidatus Aminicenantes bacterium]|nr:hypothetical protein [Candidatus Aminicenantes bacterium]
MKKWIFTFFICVGLLLLTLQNPAFQSEANINDDTLPPIESCTSILVGKLASVDGSTITSHSCDSNTDRTWINIVPHKKHKPGSMAAVYHLPKRTKGPDD